ncbi:hypothetical protein F2Q68_00037683 [Brassica cretica]|uniref:Putative gamma-glutamylcyclotransferase n=1 Tax=Brassica cretica TaxID=69181 RepID=A0A8S9H0U9_BRACR|nr:hypothetical protein F2Q68_00037683 [Brassica cretica]
MSILSGKAAGHDLFVYGSLQDPQVVNVLLNRVPDHSSAVLSCFHRFKIKNRLYPTILPDGNGQVTGKCVDWFCLILGFSFKDLRSLNKVVVLAGAKGHNR